MKKPSTSTPPKKGAARVILGLGTLCALACLAGCADVGASAHLTPAAAPVAPLYSAAPTCPAPVYRPQLAK